MTTPAFASAASSSSSANATNKKMEEYNKAKEAKPDTDVEKRRRDMDTIPLSRYNLVPTMQRMDRIRKRPKRSFHECLTEILTTTRYRLNKELLAMDHHEMRPYVDEYELGVREACTKWLDRVCPR
jgi:N-formylglutamate amidohydrolase